MCEQRVILFGFIHFDFIFLFTICDDKCREVCKSRLASPYSNFFPSRILLRHFFSFSVLRFSLKKTPTLVLIVGFSKLKWNSMIWLCLGFHSWSPLCNWYRLLVSSFVHNGENSMLMTFIISPFMFYLKFELVLYFNLLSPCERSEQEGSKFNWEKKYAYLLIWCQRICLSVRLL